ncbi:MAG: putative baseplate assembly protein [ANME-2 cluster archaeon]|nr:MAG: putative baseplate assembly protein [ANME-2 cluster archaeon]
MVLPKENLDNKTFEELVKEAVLRIPIYAPGWTDHNIHDPGITFIELFAWLAEIQLYSMNRIGEKSYRKFLKLMGIKKLEPAKAANVDVTFSLQNIASKNVPAGTMIAAKGHISGKDILFETKKDLLVDSKLETILTRLKSEKFIDNSKANMNENVYYYAFGYNPEEGQCIPNAGDEFYLGFDKSLTGKELPLTLHLFKEDLFKTERLCKEKIDLSASTKLSWEYYTSEDWTDNNNWKSIEEITDETEHLTISGKIWMKIQGTMGKVVINNTNKFWIRCRVEEAGYEITPKIDLILINTVSAIQRSALKVEKSSSSGLPEFIIDLKDAPVLDKTLTVKFNNKEWRNDIYSNPEVEDFDASNPEDKHYTVDLISGRVTFGNGINGKIPPAGTNNITVSYRTGGGVHGNTRPHSINMVLDEQLAENVTVDNLKAATGGKDSETLKEAIYRARKDLKTVYRAVTSQDYEHLIMNTPKLKVARAKAIPRYHPSQTTQVPGIVSIIIVPKSPYAKPMPGDELLKTVYRYLEKQRLLATELFVIPPEYTEISVSTTVKIKPRFVKETVKNNVKTELDKFLNPITGGVEGNGWPFGRSVYLSEIYQIIDSAEGVDYVKSVKLNEQEEDIDIPSHGLVYSGDQLITAEE